MTTAKFTRGELHRGPDEQGRYGYALFWIADYHPLDPSGENRIAERGQQFFGPLPNVEFTWQDKR